jgi:acetyl-CoA acetyltransferase family protein
MVVGEGTGVAIVAGARTPFARAGGELADVGAVDLARTAIVEATARAECDPDEVRLVILGNVGNQREAPNLARLAALRSGFPAHVPGMTVQRNCASGLDAIVTGALRISDGWSDVVVAGGVESMSGYPLLFREETRGKLAAFRRARDLGGKLGAAGRFRPSDLFPEPALESALRDPASGLSMGETAELLAREFQIGREAQDAYALTSHQNAVAAEGEGRLAEERVPFPVPPEYERIAERDTGPRAGQTKEQLARLKPAFQRDGGTVTAGNACQVTDGAAAVVLTTPGRAREWGVEPLGTLRSWAFVGVEPEWMGLGPVYASAAALTRAGVPLNRIDLVEINEAFASQVLACKEAFRSRRFARDMLDRAAPVGEIGDERLNVNGGAIALGHPVGATGARLVLTLLHEMRRRDAELGLAALCVGGGQGAAVVLERSA